MIPSVGGYPLVLERGWLNEGASIKLLGAKIRSSPTTTFFLAGVSVFHISTTSLHLR